MREQLTYIKLADGNYPIKCDLVVLEAAQEEYGKLSIFELELGGLRATGKQDENGNKIYVKEEPSMKALRFALPLMVNEGIDIENRMEQAERKHISSDDLGLLIAGVNVFELAEQLHEDFKKCFVSKNRNSTRKGKSKH